MAPIENLVVFMSDGVRWDYRPESVVDRGLTFNTVSSSLHTPTSIASMLTGRHLPSHRIRGFTDRLDSESQTVLDWFPNAGLDALSGNFNDAVYSNLLDRYPEIPLSDIDEPFGWFMRDPGGHAPYDGFDDSLETEETVRSYLRAHGGDTERMRRDYASAIGSSVDRFERLVLGPLEARGIRDNTLIVFISDHGQMLGEHGHVGESYPACPEVVYVPTTFIHPSLDAAESDDLFRHVDLAPTVASLLERDVAPIATDGVDVLADGPAAYGANLYDRPFPGLRGEFSYTITSLWNHDGGHVFVESGLWDKFRLTVGLLTRIPAGIHVRRTRSPDGLKMLFENQRTWGSPSFSVEEAREYLERIRSGGAGEETLALSDATEEHLRELGYL